MHTKLKLSVILLSCFLLNGCYSVNSVSDNVMTDSSLKNDNNCNIDSTANDDQTATTTIIQNDRTPLISKGTTSVIGSLIGSQLPTGLSIPDCNGSSQTGGSVTKSDNTAGTASSQAVNLPGLSPNQYSPLNFSKQNGVWMSYLDLSAALGKKNEASFSNYINSAFDKIKAGNCNTVYVQVRAFGDAYYKSSVFPNVIYNGKTVYSVDFDPLKLMVDIGHKKGLSIHAWVNPMRLMRTSLMPSVSNSYLIKKWYNDSSKKNKYIVDVGGYYWLNPAYAEVRQLIANGVAEIVSKYNVDGIQIDDYFYQTTDCTFDSSAYSSSGYNDVKEFRRHNTDLLVSLMYSSIKAVNRKVLFGISPQGNYNNDYNYQCIDLGKWLASTGYMDYCIPQFYYNASFYYDRVDQFASLVKNRNIKFIVGLAPYKVISGEAGFTIGNYLTDQLKYAQQKSVYGGCAFFRYEYFVNTSNSIYVNDKNSFIKLLE